MSLPGFDRRMLRFAPLSDRENRVVFPADAVSPDAAPLSDRETAATRLATNGAGIIHDWELAFQGGTSEDVRGNIARGQFGIWEETGRILPGCFPASLRRPLPRLTCLPPCKSQALRPGG